MRIDRRGKAVACSSVQLCRFVVNIAPRVVVVVGGLTRPQRRYVGEMWLQIASIEKKRVASRK